MIHSCDPIVVDAPESLRISALESSSYLRTIYDGIGMRKEGLNELLSRHQRLIDHNKIWFSEPDEVQGYRVIRIIRNAPGCAQVDGVLSDGTFFQYRCVDKGILSFRDFCISILSGFAKVTASDEMTSLSPYSGWFRSTEKSLFFSRVNLMTKQDDPYDWRRSYERFYKTGFFSQMNGVTRSRIARAMRASNKRLLEALDVNVLRALRRTGRMRMRDAEWLSGSGDGAAPVSSLREARCQAAMIYPTLMSRLSDPAIDLAITSRKELTPVLAAELGIRRATIRRLSGVSWQMAAIRPSVPDLSIFRDLADHHFPSTKRGFSNLAKATRSLRSMTGLASTGIADARGVSPDRILEIFERQSPDMILDYLNHLHDTLVAPLKFRRMVEIGKAQPNHPNDINALRISRAIWADHALKTFGLRALMEGSQAWHRAPHTPVPQNTKSHGWRPLFGSYLGPDGIILREISSASDMHAIGKHQHHCVGGYAGRVTSWNGRGAATLIVTLERDGLFASTAEISIFPKGNGLKGSVSQNRATANKPAEPWTSEFLLRLCGTPEDFGISAAGLSEYAAGLSVWRRRIEEDTRLCPTLSVFGFSALDDDEMRISWERAERVLPPTMRKSGYDHLSDALPDGIFPCSVGHESIEGLLISDAPF